MELLGEAGNIPSDLAAYGWIPFVVVILLSLIFSFLYVRYFWYSRERDRCSALTAIVGLSIALLAAFLLPVDVFSVSFMKNADGSFKDWATNATRQAVENSISWGYYTIYIIIVIFAFFILPLVYFAYEERDDFHGNSCQGLGTAFMYTFVFFLLAVALFIAGAFIPYKGIPSKNSTEWDKIEFLINEMYSNRGEEALNFVLNILTIFGMINLIFYTGVGMASFPLTLMRGFRSLLEEEMHISASQCDTQAKINTLRKKQSRKALSSHEVSTLADLEEQESLISRRAQLLESERKSIIYKLSPIIRFISAMCGVFGILFALLLWISLLITNIDKFVNSLGYKMGYVLKETKLPNPLDIIMVQSQRVFPLDYILFFAIVIFLVMCTISGVRYIGIRVFCILMYKVRPHRTEPQGLIMLCAILMYSILAFNVLMYSVIPNYVTYGNQNYCAIANLTVEHCDPKPCNMNVSSDDCVMSRASVFLMRFAFKAWIFGASYFWLTWGFLVTFLLGFIITLIRARKSSLEEAIDIDDFDDSDEHLVQA